MGKKKHGISRQSPLIPIKIPYLIAMNLIYNPIFWLIKTQKSPQEHDQRAMGAFLNYTERISLDAQDVAATGSGAVGFRGISVVLTMGYLWHIYWLVVWNHGIL